MKSNWLYVILVSVAFARMALGASSTESADRQPVRIGIEAGMTFSNVRAPADVTPSNRAGLAVGLNAEFPLAAYLSIQPELLFVQRGVNLARVGSASLDAKYNSLEIPLLAKVRLNYAVSPFLVAGPVAIWNISRSVVGSTPNDAAGINFNPNTFDFGVALGGGVDIGPFFATLRYTLGITNLDENSADFQSRGVHLLAGLRF
jgi:hypothetical protein